MLRRRFPIVVLIMLLLPGRLLAQTASQPTTPWGTWHIGTLVWPGSATSRWGGFAEVQVRSNALFSQYFYHELKGGLSYNLDKNVTVTVAGGRYSTADYQDPSAGPLNVEKRLWQQLVLNQFLNRIKFEQRYRIEQRWLNFRDGGREFRNRIRYRLNLFVPINNRQVDARTLFMSVYDEIFLNPRGPAFERNRLYGGLGYQFDKHLIIQAGWVYQTNYSPASFARGQFAPIASASKNNLVLSVIYRLAPRNAQPEKVPSQPD